MPHPAAGWIAFAVTAVVWYVIRRGRKRTSEERAKRRAHDQWLASELAELDARRRGDAEADASTG
jgi:hypothetical protein